MLIKNQEISKMSKSLVDYISRKLYMNEILNDEHLLRILTEYVFGLVPQNLEDLLDCPTGFWILSII